MKVLINDQLVEYKDEGSGRVIFLLHGWGANLSTFDQMAAHLSKKYRVVRIDFPGFGQSPRPNRDWFIGDYAGMVNGVLQKLKIDQLYAVVGHSFGGRVAITAVGLGLFRPEKVILIGSAGVKPKVKVKKAVFGSIAKVGKIATSAPIINRLQPLLRERLYKAAGSTDYLDANEMQQIFLNTVNEDLLVYLSKIKMPTLLIWGEDDTETPMSDAKLMLSRLSDANLVGIANAGHFVYVEAFDKVTAEMDKFLS